MNRAWIAVVVASVACSDLEQRVETAVYGPRVRVKGHVAPGSLVIDPVACKARLVILAEDGTPSAVRYDGCVLSDSIVARATSPVPIAVEGRRAHDGVIDAELLLGRAGSLR